MHEETHVAELVSHVVEVQHDRIRFTAVDAGMLQEVFHQQASVAILQGAFAGVPPVLGPPGVTGVPLAIEQDVALAAPPLEAVALGSVPVEVGERLELATRDAPLQRLVTQREAVLHALEPDSLRGERGQGSLRALWISGKLYHIVERAFLRCKHNNHRRAVARANEGTFWRKLQS